MTVEKMTVEEILKSLEKIRDKLDAIRGSSTYQTLASHPEYFIKDVGLADSIQGVDETLEMISYISELSENGQI